jgi:hypothetical protein
MAIPMPPWMAEGYIIASNIAGRPALCATSDDAGQVWAWKGQPRTGMSWAAGVAGSYTISGHPLTAWASSISRKSRYRDQPSRAFWARFSKLQRRFHSHAAHLIM